MKEVKYIWTDKDDQLLINNIDYKTINELYKIFEKEFPKNIIRDRAKKKGLKILTSGWTEEETKVLINNYQKGIKILVDLLPNKSKSAIQNKAHLLRLKISSFISWSYEDIQLLKELVERGTTYSELQKVFPNQKYLLIIKKCKSLGLHNKIELKYNPLSKEERQYIVDNYNKLSVVELAERFNIEINTIHTIACKNKITKPVTFWNEGEITLLLDMVKKGTNYKELKKVFVRHNDIRYILRKFNIVLNKNYIGKDNKTKLHSIEEKEVFDFIFTDFDTNINKFYEKQSNLRFINLSERYVPDFIISKINNIYLIKPLIIEYYGLFKPDEDYEFTNVYVGKTLRKNQHYKSRNDIYFIDLYPEDLKHNYQGIKDKLDEFINKLQSTKYNNIAI